MSKQSRLQPMEVRTVRANQFNFNDNNLNVNGYVNETGKQSDPIPNFGEVPDDGTGMEPEDFVEIMQPGVFKDALNNADFVDFYLEHDPDKYLASTQQGSLKLNEDNKGLKMSANITPTSWGQDTYTLIKSGAVQSMSFGFIPLEDNWNLNGDTPVRTVTKIQLLEVSAVRFPAYPDSSIDARKKRFTRLNNILEKRGFTLRHIRKNKGGVKMPKKEDVKKTEKRANTSNNGMTSADAQNIVSALSNLSKSVDNHTNAIQENSEVQSNIADQIMQSANGDRSKKDVHKASGKGKSEKRDDSKEKPKKTKEVKSEKPKVKKPKVEKKSKKTDPKAKKSDERKKKPAEKAGVKRSDPNVTKMIKALSGMTAK